MATNTVASPAPGKRRGWLRVLAWIVGILVLLIIVAYFVGTSSAFLKGFILPRVSKSLNAEITVSDASISPFSQVILRDLKVQTTGTEPLLAASEVRLRYSLMDIIRGNMHVDEIAVAGPTVTLVQNPDKTSNLDPILKAQQQKPQEAKPTPAAQPAQPSRPMQIDLRKLTVTDATLRQITLYQGANRDVAEVAHLFLTVDNIKNGQAGKVTVTAALSAENNPPAPGAKGLLQAKLNGAFDFSLTPDLKPGSVKGNTHLEVTQAEGAMAQAAAFAGDVDCDLTPTEIKQVALRFAKGGAPLGQLRVSGPFDMEKMEGKLVVELLSIDKNLLNMAGAPNGLDFGPTTIGSTNEIQLAKAGSVISVGGQFNVNHLQVTRTNQTTPELDFRANYDLAVDRSQSNLTLRALILTGAGKGNPFLQGALTSPMQIAWGNAANALGDSALNITVTNFDLADWKTFLGNATLTGIVNSQTKLLSQQSGKLLTFDLNTQIANLTAGAGSNQITQAGVTLQINGKATDMKRFDLTGYKFEVARQNQPLLTVSGAGTYDQAATNADMQLNVQVMLDRLLQAMPQPGMNVSSGTVALKAHFTQKLQNQEVTGSFALTNFTGQVGSNSFRSFSVGADYDIAVAAQQVQIQKLGGQITQGSSPGGSFDLSGTYNLTNQAAQLTAKLAGFNQNGLGVFLEPALAGKKLVSMALKGNASIQCDPKAASVKAAMQVTNLVVNDPSNQIPAAPLAAGMSVDLSLSNNNKVLDLRQFQFSLTPTSRATNQVQLSGHVDMTQSNAITGNLKLASDSLDVTTYYDLFAGQKKPASTQAAAGKAPAASAAPSTPASSSPAGEPAAIQLPLNNFTADVTVGRFYLHEVEITNLQVTTKIDGGHIQVTPCKLALNGAPVSASVDADVGVPGFKYDVSFNAQAVPLAPLVNTFQPERKGMVGGTFTATTKITGAGITGTNLQKNLAGQFDYSSTNLNLSATNVQDRWLQPIITGIVAIPDLLQNPAGKGLSLVQGMTGLGGSASSSSNDLSRSVIEGIIARGDIGSGKVNLRQSLIQSPTFQAGTAGTVVLAPVLTNSALNFPITVSLERSIAQRANLVSANTPANAPYVPLPPFLVINGTVGQPGKSIDKTALAKLALQGVAGKQGLGGLLGGSRSNAPSTSTNSPPAATNLNNLLKGFLK
jgi:hypothetical protein